MEEKLAEYKRRKKRQQQINSVKQRIFNMFSKSNEGEEKILIDCQPEVESTEIFPEEASDDSIIELKEKNPHDSFLTYVFYFMSVLCWCTVYFIAIKLGFGLVYLLLSALIGIYVNTRTTPKKPGEVSAYSVFNKDCHSIDGTLKAEQFEREIRYGAASVR